VQQLIRARQIRALYQRELTSLNRDRNLGETARKQHADSLWRQAAEQLERLRRTVEIDIDALPAEQRALFDPPKRPVYLEHDE
jgi:hypothetical protein